MNAEDTKKAMKCCMKTFPLCHGCPLKGACITGQRKPLKKALELIEHYEAEIERLTVNMNAFGLGVIREKERADTAIKEFAERLTRTLVINNEENTDYFDFAYTLETIDAIKEEMTEGNC